MTCPHCGATARDNERFCPSCSRLVDSPLLKIRRELDAARAAMQRDRPAPLSKAAIAPFTMPRGPAAGSPPQPPTPKQTKNEKRKAEIRARLGAQRQAVAPPPPTPREEHTRAAHDSVPDSTLERALRSQAGDAADALERARQAQAPPAPPPPRPPKGRKGGPPKPSPRPASGGEQAAATSEPG
ncbi:MAG: zinc ribbon domain-containing protein, partial [Vicinamibacterales bacterium]|nr:zinc ribbon domain-containing protein [Vicinamibacterales bacterium]